MSILIYKLNQAKEEKLFTHEAKDSIPQKDVKLTMEIDRQFMKSLINWKMIQEI